MWRRVATTTVWSVAAIAIRPYIVARSPATVDGTEGLIVIQPDAHSSVVSVTRYDTAGRQGREQPDHEGDR
jgi:hypothetical protein